MGLNGCPEPLFRTGERIHGFYVLRVEKIPDIRVTAYEMEHADTGARVIHLHCEDRENLFSIGFRTPPRDSTGVAHILEHSVLAGSDRYPVKDAFNELARGTLQTFINAFTYPDKTIYPVASQVRKDYFNLARVYTDLVLRPRLLRETFYQEGHHLELEDPPNEGSGLVISGIVYNEMKGVYSSPEALMWKAIQESLYPDTVYAFDSGGNPEVIPFLTYEQLREFHRTYYSPTNANFFLYGDIPPADLLAFIEERIKGFPRMAVDSVIDPQTRWKKPARISGTYPIGREDSVARKTVVNMAWMLADNTDHETVLLLRIVSSALIGTAAGPLRKALVDSGLGEDLSPVTGLDCDFRQIAFAVGLRGTEREKADEIESLILDTLRSVARCGFEKDIIEGALHQIEFSGKEMVRRAYPYAIRLMGKVYQTWLYGGKAFAGLKFPAAIDGIRSMWQQKQDLFERLLEQWLIENPHRVLSIHEPSRTHNEEWDKTLRAMMEHSRAALSERELAEIRSETSRLKEMQSEPDPPEVLATLPKLKIEDIPRRGEVIPSEEGTLNGVPVLTHDLFTNGIAYLEMAFDVADVTEDLQGLLPILGRLTTGMGAAGLGYEEMAKRVARKTGGLNCHLSAGLTADGRGAWQKMVFGVRMLHRNIPDALAILRDAICDGDLTGEERMKDLLFEKRNVLHSSVIPSGHVFARRTAAADLSLPAHREEQWYGRTQLEELSRFLRNFEERKNGIRDRLEKLRDRIFRKGRLLCNITAEGRSLPLLTTGLAEFLDRLPAGGGPEAPAPVELRVRRSGVSIPAQVCYVARVFPAPTYGHPTAASLMVLSRALSNGYLYKRIRVQGGAYGGMSQFDPACGFLSFLSYRDPHLVETLAVYDEAVAAVREQITEDDLEKAVIGTIGLLDKPMDPAARGYTAMIRRFAGLQEETRQEFRERVFEASMESVRKVADAFLTQGVAQSAVAVYASEERLRKANEVIDPPLAIEPLISQA